MQVARVTFGKVFEPTADVSFRFIPWSKQIEARAQNVGGYEKERATVIALIPPTVQGAGGCKHFTQLQLI